MRSLEIVNQLARRRPTFTFGEFAVIHGGSPSSVANALRRLTDQGILDRIARGKYSIRPIGRLGTDTATESVPLAVAAQFAGIPHRIAYATALDHNGLLTRPTSKVQVASTVHTTVTHIGSRLLETISESTDTIMIGAVAAGHGAWVSGIERSLIDSSRRVDLVGGVSVIGEALQRLSPGEYDPALIVRFALELNLHGALRRLGSIAGVTGNANLADSAAQAKHHRHLISADPRSSEDLVWIDARFRVGWTQEQLDELGVDWMEVG